MAWIHLYCSRSYKDLNVLLHLCETFFFHIAAVNTRVWTCCSICNLIFLGIGFPYRKRSSSYGLSSRGCVWLRPLKSIHMLFMCGHYARLYWVSYLGHRINVICGKIFASLFLLAVRSVVCSTYLYREVDISAGQLTSHHKYKGTLP